MIAEATLSLERTTGIKGDWHPHRLEGAVDLENCARRLTAKVETAKAYLRRRGKYVLDPDCTFVPTPYTDRFSISERYGQGAAL